MAEDGPGLGVDFDLDGLAYWRDCAEHRLPISRCRACARMAFPPRRICPSCWSDDVEWVPATGDATLWAFETDPLAPDQVTAVVELADQAHLLAEIDVVRTNGEPLEIGMPLRLRWIERGEYQVPVFAPAAEVAR